MTAETDNTREDMDPRIRRTREMLFRALGELLHEKTFEAITMQDIADRSTINRGTIYAHFKDKFALLEGLVREEFDRILKARMEGASGGCRGGVRQLILAVCDYVSKLTSCSRSHQPFEPVVEATVRSIIQDFFLKELSRNDQVKSCAEAELRATAGSWAICGTAMQWSRSRSMTAEEMADAVLPLISTGLLLG